MKILIENWRKYVISEGNDTNWSSKCLIFDNAGRVLLVEVANKGTLDLPGGHGQDNETPIEAVKREVFEEVGLKIDKIIKIGALSGQRLRYIFAALDFSGTFELQLEEVSDYRWYPIDELIIDVNRDSNLFEDAVILAIQEYTDQIRDIRDKADQIEYYQMYPRYKVGEYEKQKADHTDPNEL
tara:strand:- start:2378 stop:2926 length:549 start_codon:yes stop_codon:yes gene_type:complete